MRIVKPGDLSLTSRVVVVGRDAMFTASVLAAFAFDNPDAPLPEDAVWAALAKACGKQSFDGCTLKNRAEFIVHGAAYAPGGNPAAAVAVSVRVGDVEKRLIVFGDRHWVDEDGAFPSISDPVPFTRMELGWATAFGGQGFAANPHGKGAAQVTLENGASVSPLPNVEFPDALIDSPDDRPDPACLDYLGALRYTRGLPLGTYDQAWLSRTWPHLPPDISRDVPNSACPDQWMQGYFAGGEEVELVNLSPASAHLRLRLPMLRARMFVRRKRGENVVFEELIPQCDTAWILPEDGLVICAWRAMTFVPDEKASDITHISAAFEPLRDAPRPKQAYLDAMAPAEPAPAPAPDPDIPPKPPSGLYDADEIAERAARTKTLAGLDLTGLDLAGRSLSGVDFTDAVLESANLSGCDLAGANFTGAILTGAVASRANFAGADLTGASAQRIAAIEASFTGADLSQADLTRADLAKADLSGAILTKAVMDRAQLAGARLSGCEATSASFAGAILTSADLSLAGLDGADFAKATLTGANLTSARAKAASLRLVKAGRAVFAQAILAGAKAPDGGEFAECDFSGADLSQAVFCGCDLSRAKLGAARLDGAAFRASKLAGADATRASAVKTVFDQADLSGAKLAGVNGFQASLRETALADASVRDANFYNADFYQAKLHGTDFTGTNLKRTLIALWRELGME